MNRYWMLLFVALGISACSEKNADYYLSHPKELKSALEACSSGKINPNCEQIKALGDSMNRLAYELQINPQGFGSKIMKLQETIASQQALLKKQGTNPELQKSLDANLHNLKERLAVVQWLESPVS